MASFFSPAYTQQQQQQLGTLNQQSGSLFGNAQNLYSTMAPQYNSILQNPGYTPSQVSNLYSGALQPISSSYGSAAGNLGATAARTRNNAGLYSAAAGLAGKAAQGMGQAGSKVATQVANYPRQETFQALSGLQNLYNPTLSAGTNLSGQATNIADNPKSPSIFSDVLGAAGAAGGLMTGIGALTTPMNPFSGAQGAIPTGGYQGARTGSASLMGYAKGGKVKKGKAILVGEQGPEMFTPPKSGRIIPNHNLWAA